MTRNTGIALGTAAGVVLLLFLAVVLMMVMTMAPADGNDGVATSGPLVQTDDQTPLPDMQPAECNFDAWVGLTRDAAQTRVDETGRPARILPPGSAMTMDYRPDRINVELDDNDIVTRVFCG